MPPRRKPKPKGPTARVRRTSKVVAESPGCVPLLDMWNWAKAARPKAWTEEVAERYLRAIEKFDDNVANGVAKMGDLQNGKGDFFNDLLALILAGCAEVELYSRGGVPGFIFPTHNLDITHPNTGTVKFTVEAKALGTPKHPDSEKQGPLGRPGSADIKKRVSEMAFKTVDLKAEYGRIEARAGRGRPRSPGGNLTSWSHATSPKAYLFIAARVISEKDLALVIAYAHRAAQIQDGVGLFAYMLADPSTPTRYVEADVPTDLAIDRILHRACEDLDAISAEQPTPLPDEEVERAAAIKAAAKIAGDTDEEATADGDA